MAGGTSTANLRVTIDGKSAEAGMRSLAAGSDKLTRSLLGVNAAARTLGGVSLARVFAGLSVGYLTYELYGMSKQILEIGNQFQGLRVAMESAVGNKSRAAQEMKFVREEANRLGVNVLKSVDAFTKLAASTRDTALEGEMTRRAFTAIAQAARALSLSSEQQYGAFVAIYQIASKAKVSMEELRQQLGDRLPGAMNIAARAMGMTTNDFYEFVAAGKLASTDFLPKFIAELEKLYTAGAQAAAKLPTAELERLTNTLYETANVLYEEGIGEAFAELFRNLNEAIKAVSFADLSATAQTFGTVLSVVGKIVVFLAENMDTLFKLLLVMFAGKIMAGLGNMVSGFMEWRKGIIAARVETQKLLETQNNWLRQTQRAYNVAARNVAAYSKSLNEIRKSEKTAMQSGMAAAATIRTEQQLKSQLNKAYAEYNKMYNRFQALSARFGQSFASNVMVAPFTTMQQKLQQLSQNLKQANNAWSVYGAKVQDAQNKMRTALSQQGAYAREAEKSAKQLSKSQKALTAANTALATSFQKVQAAAALAATAGMSFAGILWRTTLRVVNLVGIIGGLVAGFFLFKNVLFDWRSDFEKAMDDILKAAKEAEKSGIKIDVNYDAVVAARAEVEHSLRYIKQNLYELQAQLNALSAPSDTDILKMDVIEVRKLQEAYGPLKKEFDDLNKLYEERKRKLEELTIRENNLKKIMDESVAVEKDLAKAREQRATLYNRMAEAQAKVNAEEILGNAADYDEAVSAYNKIIQEVADAELEMYKGNSEFTKQAVDARAKLNDLLKQIGVAQKLSENQKTMVFDEEALVKIDEYIESLHIAKKVIEDTANSRGFMLTAEMSSIANLEEQIALLSAGKKLHADGVSDAKESVALQELIKASRKADVSYIEQQNERLGKQLETIRDITKALKEQVEDRQSELQYTQARWELEVQLFNAVKAGNAAEELRLRNAIKELEINKDIGELQRRNAWTLEQSGVTAGASNIAAELNAAYSEMNIKSGIATKNVAEHLAVVRELGEQYKVPLNILLAVIAQESRFVKQAKSKDGGVGLMQLTSEYTKQLAAGYKSADAIVKNLAGGIIYLSELVKQFGGDWEKAIAAYNTGPGNVQKAIQKAQQNGGDWISYLPKGTNAAGVNYDAEKYTRTIINLANSLSEYGGTAQDVSKDTQQLSNSFAAASEQVQKVAGLQIDTSQYENLINIAKELGQYNKELSDSEIAALDRKYVAQKRVVELQQTELQLQIGRAKTEGRQDAVAALQLQYNEREKLLKLIEGEKLAEEAIREQSVEKLARARQLIAEANNYNAALETQNELQKQNLATVEELDQALKDINREIKQSDLEFALDWADMTGASADEFARLRVEIFRTTAEYEKWANTVKTGLPDAAAKAQDMINKTEEMIRTEANRDRFRDAMSGISDAWDDVWDAMIDETKSFTEFLSDFLKQWAYKLAGDLLKQKIVLPIAAEILGPFFDLKNPTASAGGGVQEVVDAVERVRGESAKTTDAVQSVEKTATSIGGGLFNLLAGLFSGTWQFLVSIITLLTTGSFAQAGESMAKAGSSIMDAGSSIMKGMSGIKDFFGSSAWSFSVGSTVPADTGFNAAFAARTGTAVPTGGAYSNIGAGWYSLAAVGGYFGANALYKGKGYSGIGGSLGAMGGLKLGAMIGSSFGPVGAAVGAVIGAIAGTVAGGALGSMVGGRKVKGGVGYYDYNRRQSGAAHADTDPAVVDMMTKLGETMVGLGDALKAIQGFGDMWNYGASMTLDTDSAGRMDATYNSYARGLQKASFQATEDAARWFVEQMVEDVKKQFELHGKDFGALGAAITNMIQGVDADQLQSALGELAKALPAIMEQFSALTTEMQADVGLIAQYNAKSLEDITALMVMARDVQEGYGTSLWETFQVTKELQNADESLLQTYERLVNQFIPFSDAMLLIHGEIVDVNSATIRYADSLAELAGGLDQLQALQAYYFENYYTEEERLAAQRKLALRDIDEFNKDYLAKLGYTTQEQIDAFTKALNAMGYKGPATVDSADELKVWMTGLDLTTEVGRELYVMGLKIAESFKLMEQGIESAWETINDINIASYQVIRDNSYLDALDDIQEKYKEQEETLRKAAEAAGVSAQTLNEWISQLKKAEQVEINKIIKEALNAFISAAYGIRKAMLEVRYAFEDFRDSMLSDSVDEIAKAKSRFRDMEKLKTETIKAHPNMDVETKIGIYQDVLAALEEWANAVKALEQAWKGFADTLEDTIQSLRFSAASPIGATGQMAQTEREIARVRGEYGRETDSGTRLKLAEELASLYQRRLGLAGDVYDRTSSEYMRIYNETMQALNALQIKATSEAERQTEILKTLVDKYEFYSKRLNHLMERQQDQIKSQLDELIAANVLSKRQLAAAIRIVHLLGGSGPYVPGYQQGTSYVPQTGLYKLHQGEQVIPVRARTDGEQTITINLTVNGAANGDDVAQKVRRMMPEIKRAMRRN